MSFRARESGRATGPCVRVRAFRAVAVPRIASWLYRRVRLRAAGRRAPREWRCRKSSGRLTLLQSLIRPLQVSSVPSALPLILSTDWFVDWSAEPLIFQLDFLTPFCTAPVLQEALGNSPRHDGSSSSDHSAATAQELKHAPVRIYLTVTLLACGCGQGKVEMELMVLSLHCADACPQHVADTGGKQGLRPQALSHGHMTPCP